MVIFVGKFFGNMVISITTHWSFRLYGPFLAGPDVDHISGIDCTLGTALAVYNCKVQWVNRHGNEATHESLAAKERGKEVGRRMKG